MVSHAISVANLQIFNSPLYFVGQLHEQPASLLRQVVNDAFS